MENYEGVLGQVQPEIVALSGQTVEEVKDILKRHVKNKTDKEKIDQLKTCTYKEIGNQYKAGCFVKEKCETFTKINESGSPKLIFEDTASSVELNIRKGEKPKNWNKFKDDLNVIPDLRVLAGLEEPKEEVYITTALRGDFDQFSGWRKTAGLKTYIDDDDESTLNPTKELMDLTLVRIKDVFPKITAKWTKGTWNPRLVINDAETTICLERLATAYKGLVHITDAAHTQSIIINIILKKIKELFI